MDYRANIHKDNTVSLVSDRDGQRIHISTPWNPIISSIPLTQEQFDELFLQSQDQVIIYDGGQFQLTPRYPIS